MMFIQIVSCLLSLFVHHWIRPHAFLPMDSPYVGEEIAFRVLILLLVSVSVSLVVYFVEKFLIQAQESKNENLHLLEKQLEHYRSVELLDTELRKFRHDIQNHFICMEHLLAGEKKDELISYFSDLKQSCTFQENTYYSGNDI